MLKHAIIISGEVNNIVDNLRITRNKRQTQSEDINDDQRHVCATDPIIAVWLSNFVST